ncbi:MAG: hypothetical protein VYA84_15620 [Planctomycetota bacterium]|nr:hypothetical protein [Planctomycetota bacterium]
MNGRINKNGGNVASYFLTPQGNVIHSVTGPVSASVLLEEANWAVELYQNVKSEPGLRRLRAVASAHQLASLEPRNNQDRKIHQLLMEQPMPSLMRVYEEIFEGVLGEKVSKFGPLMVEAARQIERAERAKRPILFVMNEKGYLNVPKVPLLTQQVINEFTLIALPLRAAPALSQLTGQPPFNSTGNGKTLIVAARSDCTQLASVSSWNDLAALNTVLAAGWMDALERNPPETRRLIRAERLLRKLSPEGTDWGRELELRMREDDHPTPELKADQMQLAGTNRPTSNL